MLRSLNGEVALVTGASRGIGRATALRLARQGADVVVTARNQEELSSLAKEVEGVGKTALVAKGDATKEQDVVGIVKEAKEKFGKIDILVNNVGIGYIKSLVSTTVEEYDAMVTSNNRSTFLFTRFIVPMMMERRYGQIITVSSQSGLIGFPNEAVYCSTKHSQVGMMESLDRELQAHNIKVCLVCPGSVNTFFGMMEGGGRTAGDLGLQAMLEADDVAEVVAFVAAQPWKSMITQIGLRPVTEAKY